MKTTHQNQNPTPEGPTCGRPCHPEQRANAAPGILRLKCRFHLLCFLAFVSWLGIVANTHATLGLLLSDTNPKAVVPGWANVTGKLTVNGIDNLPEETLFPVVITVQNATLRDYGTIYCPTLWVFNWTTYGGAAPVTSTDLDLNFWISNITGPVTITFEVNGESTDLDLPYVELTSLEARMAQDDTKPTIDAANYDQDVFFKAIFSPSALPTGITFDDVNWFYPLEPSAGTPWAKLTAADPGHPTVEAQLGAMLVSKEVWKVKVVLKEIELGADVGFREIKRDPGDGLISLTPTYAAPHWDVNRSPKSEYPVLIKVDQKLTAKPLFSVEPSDFIGSVMYRATGDYDMGEHTTGTSPGKLQGEEMTAGTEVDVSVGHETPALTWEFKIPESNYSLAGTSVLDIYRSLSATATDYITVVDIACSGIEALVIDDASSKICGKFAGLAVEKYKSGPMFYWLNGARGAVDYGTLIQTGNGNCQAWAGLCFQALQIHDVKAAVATMRPKTSAANMGGNYPDPDHPGESIFGNALICVPSPGQSNPNPPVHFNMHAGIVFRTTSSGKTSSIHLMVVALLVGGCGRMPCYVP